MRKLLPIFLALVLLLLLAGAWRDNARIAALRAEHAVLLARAESEGLMADPAAACGVALPSKLPREGSKDRSATAKQVAADFIRYGREMEAMGPAVLRQAPESLQARMLDQLGAVEALDAAQVKVALDELLAEPDLERGLRVRLAKHLLSQLGEKAPGQLLDFVFERRDLLKSIGQEEEEWSRDGALQVAMKRCAAQSPEQALAWLRSHREELAVAPGQEAGLLWGGMLQGIAQDNIRLALGLVDEYAANAKGPNNAVGPEPVTHLLSLYATTPERATEAMGLLRDWMAGDASRQKEGRRLMTSLACGQVWQGFGKAVDWIEAQNFDQGELEAIARQLSGISMQNVESPDDGGAWAEWITKTLPPGQVHDQVLRLMGEWYRGDPRAVEAWLATAEDGPAKHAAAGLVAERSVHSKPQEALQVALLIPAGEERSKVLRRLYESWPRDDDQSRAAAEAMADTYGIPR